MSDALSQIVEQANFTVPGGTPYEAIAVRGKAYKRFQHKFPGQQFFGSRDILIDALTLTFRSNPKINIWRNRIPEEVIGYCYKLVPYRKVSFVMNLSEGGTGDEGYIVSVVSDNYVRMPTNYQDLYRQQIEKVVEAARRSGT